MKQEIPVVGKFNNFKIGETFYRPHQHHSGVACVEKVTLMPCSCERCYFENSKRGGIRFNVLED